MVFRKRRSDIFGKQEKEKGLRMHPFSQHRDGQCLPRNGFWDFHRFYEKGLRITVFENCGVTSLKSLVPQGIFRGCGLKGEMYGLTKG